VALVPNGNELMAPGTPARAGRIYESNNAALASVVLAAGAIPRPFPPLPDDPRKITEGLRRALRESDFVLATGGSSVGERDHLPRILPKLGRLLFHGIAVRPGKPTLAARADRGVIVGMPGHPTSCLLNMYWLVLPSLRKLARRPGPGWSEGTAILSGEALESSPGASTVVALELRDGRAYTHYRGSAAISSLAGVNGFMMLAAGARSVRPGTTLRVNRLDAPLGPGSAP
jgi:molybdenum cofactor synthesis domain-containing protein